MNDLSRHRDMANAVRVLAMDAVEKAKSGHPGMPMGMADVATVLFRDFIAFDPAAPQWPDRDRFVLSAGHGSMLLYAILHLLGVEEMTMEEIKNFRQLESRTAGHPEFGFAGGIETTTGPLGQGLATAVGMAMAECALSTQFGKDLVDHYTYVIAGDGCLMEGISHEAISLAGHLRLKKLIVIWDDNGISIDGPIDLTESGDMLKRFTAAGWAVTAIDGHDPLAISKALTDARMSDRPTLIAAKTMIGFGAPKKAGTAAAHGSPLGQEEIAATRAALGWTLPPFEIPTEAVDAWRLAGLRGGAIRREWEKRYARADAETKAEFDRRMAGELPSDLDEALEAYKIELAAARPTVATRKASEMALEVINAVVPEMLGGSADLTGSNNTRTKSQKIFTPYDYSGSYIHYGIREFGMAAAMNGIAVHGGFIPYGGTFLAFSDYARPAMRLSALMHQRVIYVMTHDSIGLGEDGPTHQPVEHLAALRAIPNMLVIRPADALETAEAWEVALKENQRPTVLALSRQNLPFVREDTAPQNLVARGAYELSHAESGEADVSIFATGSEVQIALKAKTLIEDAGYTVRVVSVPCFELFAEQSSLYRAEVIGTARLNIGVEAAVRQGWDAVIGSEGLFVGMSGFGASAPAEALYQHFGITAETIAAKALARLAET